MAFLVNIMIHENIQEKVLLALTDILLQYHLIRIYPTYQN